MPTSASCPVCEASMSVFDRGRIMDKHDALYHRCDRCGLVATLEPTWLEEAYAEAIHDEDSGILRRNRILCALTSSVIRFEGLRGGRFLDWAGGYGVLTQLMREKGHDFWHHDDFASPVFAREFQDDGSAPVDLVTAFEVFEHLADPRRELAAISERTDRVLFSTTLLPDPPPRVGEWWYYLPHVGQHISFHTVDSLRILGEALGYRLLSNGRTWHLFHRGETDVRTRALLSPRLTGAGLLARRALSTVRSGGS